MAEQVPMIPVEQVDAVATRVAEILQQKQAEQAAATPKTLGDVLIANRLAFQASQVADPTKPMGLAGRNPLGGSTR